MRQNSFGKIWPVSALTLGGGGIGMVWGETTFDECVATVHEAVAAGINLIDLAPSYGDGRAERVIGEAFGGHQHAEPNNFRQAMYDLLRRPRVLETKSQPIGQSQPALDLA
jgi:predicted oxidoreductase